MGDFLATQGARAVASTPEEYARVIERELDTWKTLIENAGIKVE